MNTATDEDDGLEPIGPREEAEIKKLLARFRRSVKNLNDMMDELRLIYPNANFYLANDNLHVMKGPSHSEDLRCSPQHENSIAMANLHESGGGDW